jgi:cystathionine beta-lyase
MIPTDGSHRDERVLGPEEDRLAELDRLRSLTCIKWTRYDRDVVAAWVADMDLAPAPVVTEAVRALVDRGDFGYNFSAAAKLPAAWVSWQERRFGWRPDTGRVKLLCDVMQGVEVALWLHTKPGDGVVVFTPVYPPFLGAVEKSGRRVMDCRLLADDGWRLDAATLEAAIDERTTTILTCDPHNPTGRCFTREELELIADAAERHDLLVVSDEIWEDLVHPGATHIPFAALSPAAEARSVTIAAASKAFNIAGLRCAVMHFGHEPTWEAFNAVPSHVYGGLSSLGAEATLAAWREGGPWLAETVEHLTAQRDHLAARLVMDLPEVEFALPEATYLAWLDFRGLGLGDDPAAFFLEHARVALSPGPDFGPHGAGFARLNFATTREILDEIVDRMVGAVRDRG